MEEEGSSEESLERGSPGEAEGSYLSSSFASRGEFVEIPIHEDSDDTESDRLGLEQAVVPNGRAVTRWVGPEGRDREDWGSGKTTKGKGRQPMLLSCYSMIHEN